TLSLPTTTSGYGFGSYLNYSSGFFHTRIKIPRNNARVMTIFFYLMSKANSSQCDELDFEFLGHIEGQRITLHTNIKGVGDKEQRINLWFDLAANFHDFHD
ncbi:hypothetical protein C1H46_008225, partial [Malus baccata]